MTKIGSAPELSNEAAGMIIDKVIQMPKQKSSDDDPFVTLTQDEKAHWKVRMKIRTALNNIDTSRKLTELVSALEEEMNILRSIPCDLRFLIQWRP
jgi:hypothetical protein